MSSLDRLDHYLCDAEVMDLRDFTRANGDWFLLKTGEGGGDWNRGIEFQTVISAGASDPDFELDSSPGFLEEWAVVRVQKRPGNPFPERISFGRARNCDVVLRLSFVSKLHAHILVDKSTPRIVDQRSANGTRLNGVALEPGVPTDLRVGDRVGFGRTYEMTFLDAGSLHARLHGLLQAM